MIFGVKLMGEIIYLVIPRCIFVTTKDTATGTRVCVYNLFCQSYAYL